MKKVVSIVCSIVMMLSILFIPNMDAYAASFSVSGVPKETVIGKEFTLKITSPKGVSARIELTYDPKVVSYVSGTNATGGNGLVIITGGAWGDPNASSVNEVKFKTIGAGTSTMKISTDDAVDVEGNAVTVGSTSVKITVKNEVPEPSEQETPKSGDNSLKSLKLSNGSKTIKLSPSFKYNVTKYTATVDYNVKNIVVSATKSNDKAKIESVTDDGKVKLDVGKNTIKIVVKAENGVTATYTVVVTRKSKPVEEKPSESESSEPKPSEPEEPSESESQEPQEPDFDLNGTQLFASNTIPEAQIPADFNQETITIGEKEVPSLVFSKADLTVLYLENENKAGSLYLYDEVEDIVYPFVKLESELGYIIVMMPEDTTVPEGYTPCTLSIEGKGIVNAYQLQITRSVDPSDFFLIYCMNNNGDSNWYLYDSVEGTYQRYAGMLPSIGGADVPQDTEEPSEFESDTEVDADDDNWQEKYEKLLEEYEASKNVQFLGMCIGIFAGVVMVIIIINLLVKSRREEDEYEDDEEYRDDDKYSAKDFDDEIEIEFYEMPIETSVSEDGVAKEDAPQKDTPQKEAPQEETSQEETSQEETPQEKISEEKEDWKKGYVEDEDDEVEVEVEFYEMDSEVSEEKVEEPKEETKEASKETLKEDKKDNKSEPQSDDDDDDGLEFIDL